MNKSTAIQRQTVSVPHQPRTSPHVTDLAPPPAPSQPVVPAGMDGCTPLGAAPHTFDQLNTPMALQRMNVGPAAPIVHQELNLIQPGPLYNQAGSYSQGQYNNFPVLQELIQSMPIFGVLKGQVLYELPENSFSAFHPAAPPPDIVNTKKRKRDEPYVKMPLNPFMLFMKEQRPNFVAEMNTGGMAAVNTILGQKWKSLSNEEQEKYHQQADIERRVHAQRHPEWSNNTNYGVKRKRVRRQATNIAVASTSGEITQQVTSVYTGVVEAPLTHTSFTHLLDNNDAFRPESIPVIPWMESPAAPADSEHMDLANELEALVAGLMEPLPLESEPHSFSIMDIL